METKHFPSNLDRNSLKCASLRDRSELRLISPVYSREANHLRCRWVDEHSIRIVLYQALVYLFKSALSLSWTFVELYGTEALPNFWLGFPIHPNNWDGTSFIDTH